ncbi:hypothetical protein D9758_003187 [Tetrapyrgos nigripes]|uniref:Uncharacterized protein n=1 Tax=Tetrapyrgos nigripes TaxID=182062 RepID=A0A8H5LQC4_9AGAR|nr:hypothetical protein D9758_003187 [Tetrapyrgos nigripes]
MFSAVVSAALLALPLTVVADQHHHRAHQHRDIAKRAPGNVNVYKRFDGTRWTFYDVGLGACGKTNTENDFIVALNTPQYGSGFPGPNCFKSITMSYNGKTTNAVIMDECPGCPYGGLDLSRGLFKFFAPESEGVLTGNWWFNDGSDSGGNGGGNGGGQGGGDDPTSTTKQPKPTTTKEPEPEPTPTTTQEPPSPTPEPPKPSTTSTRTRTRTSTSQTSSSSSSSSEAPSSTSSSSSSETPSTAIDYSSGPASGLAVPTGTARSSDFLNVANQAIINLGGVVAAGVQAH